MKRAIPIEEVYDVWLPDEVWLIIFTYLGSMWRRFQCVTVCKSWIPLITQSVQSVSRYDPVPYDVSILSNLIDLQSKYDPSFDVMTRNGFLTRLQCLDITFTGYSGGNIDFISLLQCLKCLKLDKISSYQRTLPPLAGLTTLSLKYRDGGCWSIGYPLLLSSAPSLTDLTLQGIKMNDETLLKMSALEHLTVATNKQLTGNAVAQLVNLRTLSLDNDENYSTGMFAGLTTLTSLNLRFISVVHDDDITHLTSLRELNLHANPCITDRVLDYFLQLTRLTMFDRGFGGNGLINTGHTANISKLTKLEHFEFNGMKQGYLIGLYLPYLTQLTSLNIYDNRGIDISPLSCLTRLSTLAISNFMGVDMAKLPVSLRHLNLASCSTCYAGIDTFSTHLTNLTEITFGPMAYSIPDVVSLFWKDISWLPSLERIYYDASHKPFKRHTLKDLPSKVELLRY